MEKCHDCRRFKRIIWNILLNCKLIKHIYYLFVIFPFINSFFVLSNAFYIYSLAKRMRKSQFSKDPAEKRD